MAREPTLLLWSIVYVGRWKDGEYDGQGTKTFSDGWNYLGEWKDGGSWICRENGKNGNILFEIMNGVWQ